MQNPSAIGSVILQKVIKMFFAGLPGIRQARSIMQ